MTYLFTRFTARCGRALLLGLVALLPLASQAQLATAVNFSTGTGSSSRGITSADINGDGKLDIVTANYSTNTFGVLLNTAAVGATTPTFATVVTIATGGTTPTRVAAADFNGDGKPDLFTVHSNSAIIGVLLNTTAANATTPTFAPLATFSNTTISYSVGVAAADMNGDGKLDIVTGNAVDTGTSASVSVLLNTTAVGATAASFAPATAFTLNLATVGTGAYGVATPDVNGDGKPDIVTANHSANSASVLLNTTAAGATTPTFAAPVTLSTVASSTPFNIAAVDVNADGKPDLLTANSTSNTAGVFLNTTATGATTASFATIVTFAVGTGTTTPRGIATGDVNGDGKPDVLTANYGTNTVGVLLNTTAAGATTPTFAAAVTPAVGTGSNPITIAVADINGDGKPDALTANASSNSAGVLLNTTAAAVPTLTSLSASSGPVGTSLTLTGTNFTGPTAVKFNGIAATTFAVVNATTITATVPSGATTGPVTVTTPGGTSNGVTFTVTVAYPDLVVNTTGTIAAGTYNSITVNSPAAATLAGNVTVNASVTVNTGATLSDGCAIISGAGTFTLAVGATLGICHLDGISSSGATGAVQVTGTRTFDTDALYTYNGAAAQSTGSGLPATVRTLTLSNSTGLALTNALTATAAFNLTSGVLTTNSNALTLSATATLSETASSYVTGIVQTTRDLSAAGPNLFGGLGLTLTPATGSTMPGSTLVRRVTGSPATGVLGRQGIARYFDIQPAVNTSLNVSLTLSYLDTELNGIPEANLLLFKSETSVAGPWAPQRQATLNAATNTVSLTGIPNFSIWTLGNTAAPLPVELTAFTATAEGPAARLTWTTASEKNNARFDIERSLDGQQFTKVGELAAQGNSTRPTAYTYLDSPVPKSISSQAPLYYRLRQVDLDGTFSYSPVRTVALTGGAAGLALYPNPVPNGAATLTGAAPGTLVTVYDALGRQVTTTPADATGTAALVLPAGLSAGMYVVRAGNQALRLAVE